tara:strand:- start:7105 stop:7299 length:195 start_codon:yes stop_codon:yes gene_type:complete
MDLKAFALSLGKDIPEKYLEDIEKMADRKVVMRYCKRFPDAKKAEPKPAAKKPAPKATKTEKDE